FGCRMHAADLADRAAVDELVRGADAVVHCAFGGDSDQEAVIRTLLDAAAAAGIRDFIHLSTADVYAVQEGTLDEDAPILKEGQDYAGVKARLDALVRGYAERFHGLTVLRPAIIYGPLSDAWTIGPIQRLTGGWRPRVEQMQGAGNFVHIADLCRIIV